MASCEECWSRSQNHEDYLERLRLSRERGWKCSLPGVEGDKLRAGQFWDEATQTDTRFTPVLAPSSLPSHT